MESAITNLRKWAEKVAQAVREICLTKEAPCVGFSLVFYDHFAPEDERWNYTIRLATDPNAPPNDRAEEELEQVMQYLSEGVKRIFGGKIEDVETIEDFTVRGKLH